MIIFSPTDWTRSPSNWSNLMGSWLNTLQAVIVFFFNPSKEACVNDTFFFVSHFSRLQLRARALSFVLSPERLAWQAWEKEHAALGLFYLLHDSAISNLISFGLWNDLGFTDYIKQRSYLLYQYGLVAGNLVSTVEFGRSPQQGTSRALVRAEPKAKVLAHWSPFHYFGLVRDVLSPQRISQFPSLGISFFGSSKILLGTFPSTSPRGAYIWRGDLTERLLRYRFEGLILRILRYANSKCFCLRSNLSNDDIISAQNPGLKMGIDFRDLVWKRVWKITFFGLK